MDIFSLLRVGQNVAVALQGTHRDRGYCQACLLAWDSF
jgi:hypothetical protein